MIDDGIVEFRDTFLRRGWRGIERNYGSCSNVLLKLLKRAGGATLMAERRSVQKTGRKAGGTGTRYLELAV
jgi:hypothetical protein